MSERRVSVQLVADRRVALDPRRFEVVGQGGAVVLATTGEAALTAGAAAPLMSLAVTARRSVEPTSEALGV